MKTYKKSLAIIFSVIAAFLSFNASAGIVHYETATFKVYGNCEMCKKNIETALLKNTQIQKANWDVKTKMLTVEYNPHAISLENIHGLIAEAGYDTESIKAPDSAYNKLNGCCQYKRASYK